MDSFSKVYDMYEDYKLLCTKLNIQYFDILDEWYTHFTILESKDKNNE